MPYLTPAASAHTLVRNRGLRVADGDVAARVPVLDEAMADELGAGGHVDAAGASPASAEQGQAECF